MATPKLPDHDPTDEEWDALCDYIREHPDCSTREACAAVGLQRKDVRRVRKESVERDDDYRNARGYSDEQLVNTFRKLAVEGVLEPIVSAGKLVRDDNGQIIYKRVYSDRLVELGLKMHTPEGKAMVANKLGIEISGPDGGPIEIQRGVTFDEVAKVLQAAGKLPELEAPEGTAEIVSESDEQL